MDNDLLIGPVLVLVLMFLAGELHAEDPALWCVHDAAALLTV